jgi:hypothetical protein
VVAETGLETAVLTPKTLRHTAASMAIAAGVDVTVVQRILGHADASMTLNTSTDLWPDRPDGVSDTMSLQRTRAHPPQNNHDEIMTMAVLTPSERGEMPVDRLLWCTPPDLNREPTD